jgi:orotate phosphoribosyltransferase
MTKTLSVRARFSRLASPAKEDTTRAMTHTLAPGERVLLAEDVVTTGLSSRECRDCVTAAGATVVAATCLIDRSDGRADLGVPLVALAELDLPVYPSDRLPPELAGRPAVKPGSRPGKAPPT